MSALDFELNDDQRAIVEAVGGLLERHAGVERAVELGRTAGYDHALHAALEDAGFLGLASEAGAGLLDAALVAIEVARAGGVVTASANLLVAPHLGVPVLGPVALGDTASSGPVRYAAHAAQVVVVDGDGVRCVALEPGRTAAVASNFGYPMGSVPAAAIASAPVIDVPADRLRDLWRLALAVEAVGTMQAALAVTVEYLSQRRQFGRHIGSFQAVQHRLAECAIQVEGSRWLALEAAHHDAPSEATAVAASYALDAADLVFSETHQLSGALGFTREHPLHVFSMRLPALRLELGGVSAHHRAVSRFRWAAP